MVYVLCFLPDLIKYLLLFVSNMTKCLPTSLPKCPLPLVFVPPTVYSWEENWQNIKVHFSNVLPQFEALKLAHASLQWKLSFGGQHRKTPVREAPPKLAQKAFGHCPNSDYTPPALKRALWGTFFLGRFEQICQITVLTVHKCTKHPGKP